MCNNCVAQRTRCAARKGSADRVRRFLADDKLRDRFEALALETEKNPETLQRLAPEKLAVVRDVMVRLQETDEEQQG